MVKHGSVEREGSWASDYIGPDTYWLCNEHTLTKLYIGYAFF